MSKPNPKWGEHRGAFTLWQCAGGILVERADGLVAALRNNETNRLIYMVFPRMRDAKTWVDGGCKDPPGLNFEWAPKPTQTTH